MRAVATQQSVDDTSGGAVLGRVLLLNGNLERGRGNMALILRIKRQLHLGLALACYVRNPHGAVEQAASATLLQLGMLTWRLIAWTCCWIFYFGYRMDVGGEIRIP